MPIAQIQKALHSAHYAQNNITHNSCMPHMNVSVGQLPEQVLRNFWSLQEGNHGGDDGGGQEETEGGKNWEEGRCGRREE